MERMMIGSSGLALARRFVRLIPSMSGKPMSTITASGFVRRTTVCALGRGSRLAANGELIRRVEQTLQALPKKLMIVDQDNSFALGNGNGSLAGSVTRHAP